MSYPRDLDDYSDEELARELDARIEWRRKGKCDYCHRDGTTPPCYHPDRHALGMKRPEAVTQPLTRPRAKGTNRPESEADEEPTSKHKTR